MNDGECVVMLVVVTVIIIIAIVIVIAHNIGRNSGLAEAEWQAYLAFRDLTKQNLLMRLNETESKICDLGQCHKYRKRIQQQKNMIKKL